MQNNYIHLPVISRSSTTTEEGCDPSIEQIDFPLSKDDFVLCFE